MFCFPVPDYPLKSIHKINSSEGGGVIEISTGIFLDIRYFQSLGVELY